MENQFVPYEISTQLKEMGFDEHCIGYYTHNEKLCRTASTNNNVEFETCTHKNIYDTYSLAPTFSQAFKWFRTNYPKQKFVIVLANYKSEYSFDIVNEYGDVYNHIKTFKQYEEAELSCIMKLIEINK